MRTKENRQKDLAVIESELDETLKGFRASVHAWSDATCGRPSVMAKVPGLRWRLAWGCAVGMLMTVVGVGTLVRVPHRVSPQAAEPPETLSERASEQAPALVASKREPVVVSRSASAGRSAMRADDSLASVDSDVSRQVPQALEPLAQLMDDGVQ
jgi:hypothetical protein